MGRVFTTSFSFNDKSYTAVISEARGLITIYIPDESLQSVIPDSKVSFDLHEAINLDVLQNESAKHLIRNILEKAKGKLESPALDNLNQ